MNTLGDVAFTISALVLVGLMVWSLWNLSDSPLNPMQRIWWMLAILILPGVGSISWWWWIRRYYPRRRSEERRVGKECGPGGPGYDEKQRRGPTTGREHGSAARRHKAPAH